MAKFFQDKKYVLFIILCVVLVALYAVISGFLSFPYRAFPSDDVNIFLRFESNGWAYHQVKHQPVWVLLIQASKTIWLAFSDDIKSSLLLTVIIPNTLTLFALGWLIFYLTKSFLPAVVTILLYGTSAWPANYLFFAHYPPLAAFWSFASVFLIVAAYVNYDKKNLFLIFAGISSAALFFTSPSAFLLIFLQFLVILYLFSKEFLSVSHQQSVFQRFRLLFFFLIPFFISLIIGTFKTRLSLIRHFLENIESGHKLDALNILGYIPHPPFFTFFRMGLTYAPVIFIIFLMVSLLFFIFFMFKFSARGGSILGGTNRISHSSLEKILFSLVAIIYLHSILIDVLPFSKLSRAQFPIYPIVIVAIVMIVYYFLINLSYVSRVWKFCLYTICFIFLILAVITNIKFFAEMASAKQFGANYLTRLSYSTDLYILRADPHAKFIKAWLDLDIKEIDNLNQIEARTKKKIALIIGPHGEGSGKSISTPCILPDFLLDQLNIVKPQRAKEIYLPYYVHFPSFLFEEEICEALYLSGKTSDYSPNNRNLNITVWLWND